jgi:hypothetical protein
MGIQEAEEDGKRYLTLLDDDDETREDLALPCNYSYFLYNIT